MLFHVSKISNLHQNFSWNGKPPIDLGLSASQGYCVVFLSHSLSQLAFGELYKWVLQGLHVSLHTSQVAHQATAYLGFCSMNQ